MYQERPGRIGGSVIWTREVPSEGARLRIVPDGCMDLIWVDGQLLVAGPDTVAHEVSSAPGAVYVGLRFAPGTGPMVFGVPASELRDQRVPLNALWQEGQVRRLAERISDAPDRAGGLEEVALGRLSDRVPDLVVAEVVAGLRAGRSVAEVATAIGFSERQLHRRSLAAFGYGPKTLARVLRLERALTLAATGIGFAEVAASAGYADQSHLSREARALTGSSPRTLLT